MLKKNLTLLALVMTSLIGLAQFDSIPEPEEDYFISYKDLREAETFRIGADFSTVTIHSLLGAPTRVRGSFIINKKIAPNKAIRFIPAYEKNRRFYDFNLTSFNIVEVRDSTVIYEDEYLEEYRVTSRFGVEWFKQYQKNTAIYGVDLVLGYTSKKSSLVEWSQNLDENGNVIPLNVGAGFFSPDEFSSVENYRYLVGIDFSLGYKVWLGEKVDLTIEWIPEISYRPFMKRSLRNKFKSFFIQLSMLLSLKHGRKCFWADI